jgi:BirA family transcriptional regulator, biotin operon repressor / biotin---[acetyl-CoA-carboxylase] ligase
MLFALSPVAAAAGYRLDAHDTVSSTNTLALEAARSGDAGKIWFAALKQEAGRGRRARAWQSPHGNLAATYLHVHKGDTANVASLGFVAGLALVKALDAVANGKAAFKLKWPNDALAMTKHGTAKLSGILLESAQLQNGDLAVAVGIGVNIVAHPTDTPFPATSLQALGLETTAHQLFLALSDAWVDAFRMWDHARGLGMIRSEWLKHAASLGEPIAIRHQNRVIEGVFDTIDADCRIVIRDRDGQVHHITAGDVHFGDAASILAAASHE